MFYSVAYFWDVKGWNHHATADWQTDEKKTSKLREEIENM
jgi:hypothetical protein